MKFHLEVDDDVIEKMKRRFPSYKEKDIIRLIEWHLVHALSGQLDLKSSFVDLSIRILKEEEKEGEENVANES